MEAVAVNAGKTERVKAHLLPPDERAKLKTKRIGRFWFVDGCRVDDGRFTGLSQKEKAHLSFMNGFYSSEQGTRLLQDCLLYTSPSPRDRTRSRMPSSA